MMQNNSEKKVKVIGITGGVGSGKSVVMDILRDQYGAAVILADLVAHDLMEPGEINYQQIVEAFGTEILSPDGTICRPSLSAIVFSSPEKLDLLNGITHPNVRREILRRIENYQKQGYPLIALEAALLIEGDYDELLDDLWYIYVSEENRIQRLMEGRGYTEEKSRSIMKQQLPEEAFRAHCSTVIDNNGDIAVTGRQVEEALKKMNG